MRRLAEFTPKQLATWWNINDQTIANLVARGALQAVRREHGRRHRVFVTRASVLAFLRANYRPAVSR